ncbi:MAG: hypothetical protein ACJAZP_002243 [Psychromonas sp.]|jgi:hypothetical protein
MNNNIPWWGKVNLNKDSCLQLDIGPFSVAIEYNNYE